jgi:hypothetical protein
MYQRNRLKAITKKAIANHLGLTSHARLGGQAWFFSSFFKDEAFERGGGFGIFSLCLGLLS